MKSYGALTQKQKLYSIGVVAVAMLLSVLSLFLLPKIVKKIDEDAVAKASSVLAVSQAAELNKKIEQVQAFFSAKVNVPDVAGALAQSDAAVMQAAAEKIHAESQEYGVLGVRLIPIGEDYSNIGLRFSQLDRLSVVAKGMTVYPEAFDEGGQKRFDFLIEVKNNEGKKIGYVLAVLNSQVFEKSFMNVKPETCVTVLQQRFGAGNGRVIFRSVAGEGMEFISSPADTSVPHWKVLVVPGQELLDEEMLSPAWQYAVQILSLLVCVFALYAVNRKAKVATKQIEAEHTTPIQIKGARKINKSDVLESSTGKAAEEDVLADPLFQIGDVFDLDLDDDLEVKAASSKTAQTSSFSPGDERFEVPVVIFRDYDIRGNADNDISDELATRIGRAFASECIEKKQNTVVLAGDGRLSTPRLKAAVQEGIQAAGCNVIDIGIVPTPLMNFAANMIPGVASGIMVTASHNQASDNGFKMVVDGHTLASDDIIRICERVQSGAFSEGEGKYSEKEIIGEYVEHIISDIVLAGSYKVVVDCANGVAGEVAPRLFEELGCDVIPLYCDVDGNFPNHAPDPSVLSNLDDLVAAVRSEGADLGIAFDGDGDRLTVVSASGSIILPDSLLMLFARDVLSRNPGTDVIFDVKSTRRLNALISGCGGRPVMWKSGHSHIKNKMLETGAMLGGELSGHIFFKERWFGFDDGIYSAARLLEIMSIRDQDLDAIFAELPVTAATPEIRVEVPEDAKFSIVSALAENGQWGNGKVITVDGVRVDFAKGWGLVRASNTSAALTLRFEADDADSLLTVQHVFKQQLLLVDSTLQLPF